MSCARASIDLGAAVVLATQGAAGATLEAGDVLVTRPVSVLPGAIVDTMGAGDATLAAAVASLVEDRPDDEDAWALALERAMDVAAATCRFEGALLRLPSALVDVDLEALGTCSALRFLFARRRSAQRGREQQRDRRVEGPISGAPVHGVIWLLAPPIVWKSRAGAHWRVTQAAKGI